MPELLFEFFLQPLGSFLTTLEHFLKPGTEWKKIKLFSGKKKKEKTGTGEAKVIVLFEG